MVHSTRPFSVYVCHFREEILTLFLTKVSTLTVNQEIQFMVDCEPWDIVHGRLYSVNYFKNNFRSSFFNQSFLVKFHLSHKCSLYEKSMCIFHPEISSSFKTKCFVTSHNSSDQICFRPHFSLRCPQNGKRRAYTRKRIYITSISY